MVFADIVYADITFDKTVDVFEERVINNKIYNKNYSVSKLIKFEDTIPSINFEPFFHTVSWRVEFPNKLLYINNTDDKQFFFLESLDYLIHSFFKKQDIKLNGTITGIDSIFGEEFKFILKDNILEKIL
jgi:hypothetical protein